MFICVEQIAVFTAKCLTGKKTKRKVEQLRQKRWLSLSSLDKLKWLPWRINIEQVNVTLTFQQTLYDRVDVQLVGFCHARILLGSIKKQLLKMLDVFNIG